MYPDNTANLFIVSRSLLVESWKSLMYRIILSANRDSLLSSFVVCILVICFSCLVASSTLNTMLKNSEDSGHTCLVSNFRWVTSSFSPFRIFLLYTFYYVNMCSLLYILWEVYHEGILHFAKGLF